MQIIARWFILVLTIGVVPPIFGQYINITDGINISNIAGNKSAPQWSNDSKQLLFQNTFNQNSTICIYQLEEDTVLLISNENYHFNNPTWHPDGDRIVFDSHINGSEYLYFIDLKTNDIKPLFNRKIRCMNASFSSSSSLVYFTGYNELDKRWEIYSYDFIYDNLNKLTNYKLGCSDSEISKDGKLIAYSKSNPFNNTSSIEVINWYGESVITFNNFSCEYPTWSPTGLKLLFISTMDNHQGELYSIWKNGSHLERLTNDNIEIMNPVVSPDESKVALSVLTKNGWDIFIVNFDDY